MFDGLKDKLNNFTSDVEEDADIEETEADAGEVEGEDSSADATASEPAKSVDDAAATGEVVDPDTEESAEAEETDPAEESAAVEDEDDSGVDESEDDGRDLTEKAKLFATGKTVIDEDDLKAHLEELEFALLGSDVEMSVAQEILAGV